MLVKALQPFRFPVGDEWQPAEADAHVEVPDDQVDSLVAQGLVAKPKAEKAK